MERRCAGILKAPNDCLCKEIACGKLGGGVRGLGSRRLWVGGGGSRVCDLSGRAGWVAGQQKVARTRFCVFGCGNFVLRNGLWKGWRGCPEPGRGRRVQGLRPY